MADVFVVALQHFGSIFCLDPEGDKKKKKHAEHFYFILSGEGKKKPRCLSKRNERRCAVTRTFRPDDEIRATRTGENGKCRIK
jgi:hypothetical protein